MLSANRLLSRLFALAMLFAVCVVARVAPAQDARDIDPDAIFNRFDTNGDGVLTSDEVPARLRRSLAKADANGDRKISREELEACAGAGAGADRPPPGDDPQQSEVDGVIQTLNVRYRDADTGTANDTSLDIYAPKGGTDLPVMIYVHGGGWAVGDKARTHEKVPLFTSRDWVLVSANYRLIPEGEFPINVQDVAHAIAWVHDNIDNHGGDPDKIFLMGHSAGAHLVALAGSDPAHLRSAGKDLSIVNGVITNDTQAYNIVHHMRVPRGQVYTNAFGTDPDVWKAASPALQAKWGNDVPPFLVLHNIDDNSAVSRAEQAAMFKTALEKAGTWATVVAVPGCDHEAMNKTVGVRDARTTVETLLFVNRVLERHPPLMRDIEWRRAFRSNTADPAGKPLTGTEIMRLRAHDGALYATNSYRGETAIPTSQQRAQVLRLDEAHGAWNLEFTLDAGFDRAASIESLRLERDAAGRSIRGGPIDVLIVGGTSTADAQRGECEAAVWTRGADGRWERHDLGAVENASAVSIDAITLHHDRDTRADLVVVGASIASEDEADTTLGVYVGVHDPSARGGIRWSEQPELPATQLTGFAIANETLYASTRSAIYERVDGDEPTWREVLDVSDETWGLTHLPKDQLAHEALRGLRAVPAPTGRGEVLLFGWMTRLARLDPRDGAVTVEAGLLEVVSEQLGEDVAYLQLNEAVALPSDDDDTARAAIGIELITEAEFDRIDNKRYSPAFGNAVYSARGLFLIREQEDDEVTYTLHEIVDPDPLEPVDFVRVRSICPSPFEGERDVIYAGGFCPRGTERNEFGKVSHTAWIYRGERM